MCIARTVHVTLCCLAGQKLLSLAALIAASVAASVLVGCFRFQEKPEEQQEQQAEHNYRQDELEDPHGDLQQVDNKVSDNQHADGGHHKFVNLCFHSISLWS